MDANKVIKYLEDLNKQKLDGEIKNAIEKTINYIKDIGIVQKDEWEKIKQMTYFYANKIEVYFPNIKVKWECNEAEYIDDYYSPPSIEVLLCYKHYQNEYFTIKPSKKKNRYVVVNGTDPKIITYKNLEKELIMIFERDRLERVVERILEVIS